MNINEIKKDAHEARRMFLGEWGDGYLDGGDCHHTSVKGIYLSHGELSQIEYWSC